MRAGNKNKKRRSFKWTKKKSHYTWKWLMPKGLFLKKKNNEKHSKKNNSI